MIEGKSFLVTGASGSFGRAFAQRILKNNPRRLVVFSRGEHRQEEMERMLGPHPALRYFIGDVRDLQRLEMAMQGVDYVIHAAALKIVPKCEIDPFEAIHTNVIGAENVVRAALKSGVQKVLAISTDKACSPVNLYGATKLAAEKLFIAAHNLRGNNRTVFGVCRYGNVAGSQGSVAPLFRKIAAEGKPFPITDERMTRFIITMPQAIDFVLDCLFRMKGQEIFVPKIPSAKVVDIAEAIQINWPRQIVGIRPGEKLHETLITVDEARNARRPLEPGYLDLTINPGFVIDVNPQDTPCSLYGGTYTSDNNLDWLSVDELREIFSLT